MPLIRLLAAFLFLATSAVADESTTLVTATTTITATDGSACNSFVGACVVYETGGAVAYTTTVYAGASGGPSPIVAPSPPSLPPPLPSTTTLTTTITTASEASSACNGFVGACVVYGTGTSGAIYTTTVYNGNSQPTTTTAGNGDGSGYIGQSASGNDGFIGEAASVGMGIIVPMLAFLALNVGFFVWM